MRSLDVVVPTTRKCVREISLFGPIRRVSSRRSATLLRRANDAFFQSQPLSSHVSGFSPAPGIHYARYPSTEGLLKVLLRSLRQSVSLVSCNQRIFTMGQISQDLICAVLVQTKGVGLALCALMYSLKAATKAFRLRNTPRRRRRLVSTLNHSST